MTNPGQPFSLDQLSRWPDVETQNLVAVDATDRLLLDEAADAIRANPAAVAVVGDRYGALTLGAVAMLGATGVRVHQDSTIGERALANNADSAGLVGTYEGHGLDADLVSGAEVVLLQLPKSLAELQEVAEVVAAHAAPGVVLYAGGRLKHMTTSMNEVLGTCFDDVSATLARQKSRVLVARGPRDGVVSTFPRDEHHKDLELTVCAHGGVFGGTKIDMGTRLLLRSLPRMAPDAATAVDLGCGTGILAVELARTRPDLSVLATDDSAAAVASTTATLAANDLTGRVTVLRDDAMGSLPSSSVDLVVCNPPFHLGTTVLEQAAMRLFEAAARVLRPGGELWTVWNTPLGYRAALERTVGPTRVVDRNKKFTVTSSRHHPMRPS